MEKNEIKITYGNNAEKMTCDLLEAFPFEEVLPDKNAKIVLKPNLVVAVTPDTGATTHPQIAVAIIKHLQQKGYKNITIAEGAWIGDSTIRGFEVNGYFDISKKYNVPLVDTKKDTFEIREAFGIKMEISKTILNCDFLISLPVLKGHGQTLMTCALKNMKGCLSDRSKRLFHQLGLMKPIAALNSIRCADLIIVDSLNGDLDFEEGGTPIRTDRMLMAQDSVLLDTYCASLMGFSLSDIPYIGLSEKAGVGTTNLKTLKLTELNTPTAGPALPSGRIRQLVKYIDARSACSACQANLVHALKRIDDNEGLYGLGNRKISIGQEFKGKTGMDIGVGSCCSGANTTCKGCPPTASAIMTMLEEFI
ncbi:MAG: DUF362 domain-containing protein [Sphaerochaetaceae bacterium]|nr:DUF362 domain-containing protein [Sphaerochaetaceae bacterium]